MPSIVPDDGGETVYLVLNDFGRYGRAYCEINPERADLETVADVSEDIAREIIRRLDLAGDELPLLAAFVDRHLVA
jgi:hypothetical protein